MPPQPPGALDHQVDRREIRKHYVEIEIEGLLNHLGRDEHPPCPLIRS